MKQNTSTGARAPKKTTGPTGPIPAGRTIDPITNAVLGLLADRLVVATAALRAGEDGGIDAHVSGALAKVIDEVAAEMLDICAEAERSAKGPA